MNANAIELLFFIEKTNLNEYLVSTCFRILVDLLQNLSLIILNIHLMILVMTL